MANYFFKATSEYFSYDEYIYGANYATGSSVFTGSNDSWNPATGSVLPAGRLRNFDSYVFSPHRHGNFIDTLYSPPEKYFYTRPKLSKPPVSTTLASSSFRLSSNQDTNSRISRRYTDS